MAVVETLEDDVAPSPTSTSSRSKNKTNSKAEANKAGVKANAKYNGIAHATNDGPNGAGLRNRSTGKDKGKGKGNGNGKGGYSADTHPDIPLVHPSVARQTRTGSSGKTTTTTNPTTTPLVSISDLGINPDLMGDADVDLSEMDGNANVFTLKPGEEIPEHLLFSLQNRTQSCTSRGRGTGAVPGGGAGVEVGEEEEEEEEVDEVFNALILAVPFSFLYLLLDILVHLQYSHRPTWGMLAKHLMTAIPTNRHPTHFATNPLLMASSTGSGCRLMWLVNKGSWSVVTEQAPSMGTLWILTIVQLPLSRAMIALAAVGGWLWYSGMKLIP
ncbi:hypothetical protein IAT40_006165 [Kwoniella sp. CBS 6097]